MPGPTTLTWFLIFGPMAVAKVWQMFNVAVTYKHKQGIIKQQNDIDVVNTLVLKKTWIYTKRRINIE